MTSYFSQQKRPRYFDRQQLSAQDLSLSQEYHIRRDKQLNQHLHGWGIVCGAFVSQRNQISIDISEGFAVAPSGENIYIPPISDLDLSELVESLCNDKDNKCEDEIAALMKKDKENEAEKERIEEKKEAKMHAELANKKAFDKDIERNIEKDIRDDKDADEIRVFYITAKPIQKQSNPQPAFPPDCQHPGNSMQYSRICDGVEIGLVCKLSPLHQTPDKPCAAIKSVLEKNDERVLQRVLVAYFDCPGAVSPEDDYVVLCTLIVVKKSIIKDEKENNIEKMLLIKKEKRAKQSNFVIAGFKYASRKQLLSTSDIQQYLLCLCQEDTPDEPKPEKPKPEKPKPDKPEKERPKVEEPILGNPPKYNIDDYEGILSGDISSLDIRYYDTLYGAGTYVESLHKVDEQQKEKLKNAGYRSLLDISLAETESIASMLEIDESAVLEMRGEALSKMRREEPITIPIDEYDIALGLKTPTNDLKEVGLVRQKRLREARINSVAHVANASLNTLKEVLDVSDERALRIQVHAKDMMKRK